MFEPVTMIREGTKVQILCAVSIQGHVWHYKPAGSMLVVVSRASEVEWNIKDETGVVYPSIPAKFLSPVG